MTIIQSTCVKLRGALTYGKSKMPIIGTTRGTQVPIMLCVESQSACSGMELCVRAVAISSSWFRSR